VPRLQARPAKRYPLSELSVGEPTLAARFCNSEPVSPAFEALPELYVLRAFEIHGGFM
jgi:hypothetical protein